MNLQPNALKEATNMVRRHLEMFPLGSSHVPWLRFDHLIPIYSPRSRTTPTGLVGKYGPGSSPSRSSARARSSSNVPTSLRGITYGYVPVPLPETPTPSPPTPTRSLPQIFEETPLAPPTSLEPSDDVVESARPSVEIVSSKMTAREMFECLLRHGCADLSSHIDPDQYSSAAIEGGSFGDIWRGRLFNGEIIAIKCLRFHTIKEDGGKSLKRAMREMYIWSKAEHTNVQALMGIIMFQGRLGMVSPWMEHGNLLQYIDKKPEADRYDLCVQIASGVAYLHSIEMVHGDLKALNILVSHDGIVKISDFDHSILADCTLAFSATTNHGGGTLRWMAPELLLGTDEDEYSTPAVRNFQTDVYALGMTMLETISGRAPYAEYRQEQGIYRALDKKKPPVRPDEFPTTNEKANQMWLLLLRCWDHDPAARPAAAAVLILLKRLYSRPR